VHGGAGLSTYYTERRAPFADPEASIHPQPKTIAVDLTPVLPGGENGGAKVFALTLIRRLAVAERGTSFVLLTQAASHEELAALDGENVRRVMVIGPAASANRARLFRVASRALSHSPAFVRRRAAAVGYRVHKALKRGGAGVVEALGADLLFCPFTAPTYRSPRIPTVCTIYDVQFRDYPQFFTPEDLVQRERAFLEACAGATALAAISDYSRESAIAAGPLDPRRIRTIHLRLAHASSPSPAADVLARLGLLSGRFLLYPANFWKHKNHEMLLTAFAIAARDGLPGDVKLVCTGAPSARMQWLADAARAMGLGDRAVFPGFLDENDFNATAARSAGLIFPSLYEGFGMPVLDAMALGVPVACANVTALPEVAGDAALLFDPRRPDDIAKAMVSLVTDSGLRERLVDAGKRRAVEFSDPDRMAAEYWDLFCKASA
jgi:glycosyltransferase involved in cell wall biosynthesis